MEGVDLEGKSKEAPAADVKVCISIVARVYNASIAPDCPGPHTCHGFALPTMCPDPFNATAGPTAIAT